MAHPSRCSRFQIRSRATSMNTICCYCVPTCMWCGADMSRRRMLPRWRPSPPDIEEFQSWPRPERTILGVEMAFKKLPAQAGSGRVGKMLYRSLMGTVALVAWLATWPALGPAAGQAQDMSKYPEWSGQWIKPSGIGNGQWDITKPTGRAQQPPLIPEYQATYQATLAARAPGGLGGGPT